MSHKVVKFLPGQSLRKAVCRHFCCREVRDLEAGLVFLFKPHILYIDVSEPGLQAGIILYYEADCLCVVTIEFEPTVKLQLNVAEKPL